MSWSYSTQVITYFYDYWCVNPATRRWNLMKILQQRWYSNLYTSPNLDQRLMTQNIVIFFTTIIIILVSICIIGTHTISIITIYKFYHRKKETTYTAHNTTLCYQCPISLLHAFCQNIVATVSFLETLTHWGRVTHICVGNLTIIVSDNGLSPGRRQAIVCTNAGILLIGPLGTNFSEILIGIHKFSFTKMHLKMSSAKWGPFSLGLNVLKVTGMVSGFPNIII